jgi:hypothetical protein
MRYGDKDGFKDIYDEKGELILQPDERILITEENVVPSFKTTWRYYGGDHLLEPSKGTIYLTNERIVFINIPERMFAIGSSEEERAMKAPTGSTFELGDMSPGATVREYFEIPNIEIMGAERKEGAVSVGVMVNVYVLSSGNQYHISMVLTSDSDLLTRLMNKQVKDLDELVNNLKDFFNRTDWMYMDGEHEQFDTKKESVVEEENPIREGVTTVSIQKPSLTGPKSPQNTVTRPAMPVNMRRRVPVTTEVSNRSLEYFQSLYNKGLIREEVYNKLVGQFPSSKPLDTGRSEKSEKIVPQGKHLFSPDTPPGNGAQEIQELEVYEAEPVNVDTTDEEDSRDEDLLSMISDTLSDIDESEDVNDEEAMPEDEGAEAPPKATKVRRSSSS